MNLQEAIKYLKDIRMFGATLGFSDADIISLALLKKEEENQLRDRVSKPLEIKDSLTATSEERELVETLLVYRRLQDVSQIAWIDYKTGKMSEDDFLQIEYKACDLYEEVVRKANKLLEERTK